MNRKKSSSTHRPIPAADRSNAAIRRKPGRPARISRELIIAKSLAILATAPVEDFMIKTVAHELGTASMAIYNYFGSREDLLVAVADEVCLMFKAPKPRSTWQESLRAWLVALKKHADRYPFMPSIIGINSHTSVGWLKITAPVMVLMHDQLGLRNKRLALASSLFVTTAATMIHALQFSASYRKPDVFPKLEEIGLNEQESEVFRHAPLLKIKEKELFDALFEQLIRGIDIFL
ncbi:MAG: TetR/AcrR family transcriptional regulator [Rhodocyclaceae bacterium]|jgi:AcrR family transcriptional regulator|nr:TetR/AcrR family transcriptional regulator [Rhodocyclaceae bacterium]MBK6554134.1 TetR/AcrR family transcriptional regulator [Rhodocyclaceae bacterium]MBK9310583.1 TetR/AcrR family transcriptional regulator [Rhodocyclaceae bacterium]MBK9954346.1 TetR/AcrR family transcriptional regulator [Rhodocyclaceae bacterium]